MQSKQYDFKNKEGYSLSGRLELPDDGEVKDYAIFAHCFTCSKSILAATRIPRALAKSGIAVLRFDFTGIGNSEGDFANTNFSSNVEDLLSAYEQLEKDFKAPSLLIGHSLGGAAVLKAATLLDKVKAVVSIGAPSDAAHVIKNFKENIKKIEAEGEAEIDLAGRKFTIKKQFLNDLEEASFLEGISNFKKALLVMHSPTDNVVSVDHAANIFKAAKHPKSYISLYQMDHLVSSSKDAKYIANVIDSWLELYLR